MKSQVRFQKTPFVCSDRATLIGLLKTGLLKIGPSFLACYLSVTSNNFPFSDSVNRPFRISTLLTGGNFLKSKKNAAL